MKPDDFTIAEHFIAVGDGQELYVQDWGNKKAKKPIVFLHGGPGSNAQDKHKDLYDPKVQRVIFYDQRGCGRSLPFGSLKHNTTTKLVEDIVKITRYLKIPVFVLHGGSWGSTLALAFAVAHPTKVTAMVLSGILTGARDEISWFEEGRFKAFYPDIWENYLETVPASHRHDPCGYHFKRVLGDDPVASKESGYAYEALERGIIQLDDRQKTEDFETYDETSIRTEIHYLAHGCFMPDKHILKNAHTLTMPVYLVQGRYDMVCPPEIAYSLAKKLPNSHLVWTMNGHKAEHESWNLQRHFLELVTS